MHIQFNNDNIYEIAKYLDKSELVKFRLLDKTIQKMVDKHWFPNIDSFKFLQEIQIKGLKENGSQKIKDDIQKLKNSRNNDLPTFLVKTFNTSSYSDFLYDTLCKMGPKWEMAYMNQTHINLLSKTLSITKTGFNVKSSWYTKIQKKIFDNIFGGVDLFLKIPEIDFTKIMKEKKSLLLELEKNIPTSDEDTYNFKIRKLRNLATLILHSSPLELIKAENLNGHSIVRGINNFGLIFFTLHLQSKKSNLSEIISFNNLPSENEDAFWITTHFPGLQNPGIYRLCSNKVTIINSNKHEITFNDEFIKKISNIVKGTDEDWEIKGK